MNSSEDSSIETIDSFIIERPNGYVVACAGLTFTFFMKSPWEKSVRINIAKCIDEYVKLTRKHLKWCTGERGLDLSKSEPPNVEEIVSLELDEDDFFEIGFSSGPTHEDASHYNISAFANSCCPEGDIGYLSGSIPVSWANKNEPGQFQALMHKWCKTLTPYHGYAGIGLIQSQDAMLNKESMNDVFSVAMRFPGLNIEDPLTLTMELRDSIKGVNWLNIISDVFLNKLGGKQALKKRLNKDFLFYDYDGGTMIQAGPGPQIGDVNRGIIPEYYKQLGAIVKPIKYKCKDVYLRSPEHRGDIEYNRRKSKEWFDRFD